MSAERYKSEIAGWIVSRHGTGENAEGAVRRFGDVYDMMHEGIVHFWFRKMDGTLRSAYGTLVLDIIARHGGVPDSDSGNRPEITGAVPYFDLEKDSWRCFKADSIQEIDFEY